MFNITSEVRNIFGKKIGKYRKEGKLPAVIYGKGKKTTPLFVDSKEFKKVWKEAEESSVITLSGASKESVLIYDVDVDHLSGEFRHVDFYAVDMDKPITANVPIEFEGIAPAVKERNGVLVKVIHELEIEALPKDFPRELKIDVSKLINIGDKVLVKDLNLPSNIKITAKGDSVIVLAKPHTEEKLEEQPMTVADVEIAVKKGKKEEEGAEGAVSAGAGEEKKGAKK